MEFNLITLTLGIRTSNRTALSQRLLLAGEDYADACRQSACQLATRHCAGCSAHNRCDWQLVFGQQLSADPEALRRHQKPPLPFAFTIPIPEKTADPAGMLECEMVVVGRAISCLDMLLNGFKALLTAKKSPPGSALLHTDVRDYQGTRYPLENADCPSRTGNLVVMSTEGILASCPRECSHLTIRLLSPLRLVVHGRQLKGFDFSIFVRSIMRRISSLASYYCGYEFNCDFKALSNLAQTVVCREDHFVMVGGGSWKTAGIRGYGCFNGDFGGLLPFLMLGSHVHTGKNAALGMGAYGLDFTSSTASAPA